MFNFDHSINNLMHQIHAKPAVPRVIMIQKIETKFDEFKKFAAQDLMHEDGLTENSAEVQQILNAPNMEALKTFLRQFGYCTDGINKLQQRFILDVFDS
jgi:hypothetical protein